MAEDLKAEGLRTGAEHDDIPPYHTAETWAKQKERAAVEAAQHEETPAE